MSADSAAADGVKRLSRLEQLEASNGRSAVPMPPRRWKTRVLLPAGILLTAAALLAYAAREALVPATPVRVVPVIVKASAAGPGSGASPGGVVVQAPGWVEPDPFPIGVSALIDGIVESVLVLEGEPVKAGQVVARLVDDEARLAVSRAEAELNRRRAMLKAAEAHWENPVELELAIQVANAQLDKATHELPALDATIEAEQARVAELEDQLGRNISAYQRNAATEVEVVRTRFQLAAAKGMLKATQSRREVAEAELRHHQAELAAATRNHELRIEQAEALESARAEVAMAETELAMARLALQRTEVRSPVDGVVLVRLAQPGSKLMAIMDDPFSSQPVRLYDPRKLQVRVDVPLAEAAKVGVGQRAQVIVGVLPDQVFTGRITRIVHEADLQKNTLQVKVAIDDPSEQLKPEMLARVRFLGDSARGGAAKPQAASGQQVFAPAAAIHEGSAWVAEEGRTVARRRAVEVGNAREGDWVAISSGLKPGDVLISGSVEALRDGQRIEVIGEEVAYGAH